MTLEGRVAVVTGAGRGIGRAAALRLRAAGADVLAVARSAGELDALAAECGARPLVADLGSVAACADVLARAGELAGPIDILVNNAGMGSAGEGVLAAHSFERWREAMAVNLDAPFELTRRVLPGMLERGWGRIVMVSSLAGLRGGVAPGMSAYAASKHGLLGLMRAVAVEVAPHGVTCNAVLPGSVRTRTAEVKVAEEARLAGSTVDEAWAARAARTSGGRLITAEEVAAAIAFFASEEASGINGQALGVTL
jgi:3-hydroxybutyrate dehydrogenase